MPTVPKWINDAMEKIAPSMLRTTTVTAVSYLNKNIKKLCLTGDFSTLKFAPNFTIAFRVNSTDSRHYTLSHGDAEQGMMEFIAHIHGDAVGANFIDKLQAGAEGIKVAVLGSPKFYNPQIERQLVFGDETSLSMMVSLHHAFQKYKNDFQFLIELDDANSDIPAALGLTNYRIFSKYDTFRDCDKIRELTLFDQDHWRDSAVLLTGNITSLQNFRKVLKEKNHQGKIYAKGFWLEGKKGL